MPSFRGFSNVILPPSRIIHKLFNCHSHRTPMPNEMLIDCLGISSFGVIWIRIRIRDPRSLGWESMNLLIGSFEELWSDSDWSWITDPDPSHPNYETHLSALFSLVLACTSFNLRLMVIVWGRAWKWCKVTGAVFRFVNGRCHFRDTCQLLTNFSLLYWRKRKVCN